MAQDDQPKETIETIEAQTAGNVTVAGGAASIPMPAPPQPQYAPENVVKQKSMRIREVDGGFIVEKSELMFGPGREVVMRNIWELSDAVRTFFKDEEEDE